MSAPTAESFDGRLVLRGAADYETARVGRIFNARRPDRFPAAVLMARDDDDVINGVKLAAEQGWAVSVRSGGHSWAAWSLHDDALLIDLGELRDITYDETTGIAGARPAVKGGLEFAPFLAERGRAFPGGHCASVGLGGFLLQGGQGWDSRNRGWACQSVVGLDVVTADGELIHVDENQNSDLLWAARGAGPGFPGVITRFYLQTYEQAPAMWQDTWTFALADTAELLSWMHELLPQLDFRVEPVIAATRLPAVPLHDGVTRPDEAVLLLHTTVMADSDEEVLELLAPFDISPLVGRELGHARSRTTVLEENEAQTAQNPENHRYAVDCTWTDATADELAPLLHQLWSELETEHSFAIWYGWAPPRDRPDMAFSVEANVYLAAYAIYTDPADDERYRTWVHTRMGEIAAHGRGVYIGDTDFTRRQDQFVSDASFARLNEIRAARDPQGRFVNYLSADRDRLNVHG